VQSAERRHIQSGQFWATSIASFRERLSDFRSCWIVFIHVVRECPGGLLRFSEGAAVKIFLTSVSYGICTMWPNREKCCAWTMAERCGCLVLGYVSEWKLTTKVQQSDTFSQLFPGWPVLANCLFTYLSEHAMHISSASQSTGLTMHWHSFVFNCLFHVVPPFILDFYIHPIAYLTPSCYLVLGLLFYFHTPLLLLL